MDKYDALIAAAIAGVAAIAFYFFVLPTLGRSGTSGSTPTPYPSPTPPPSTPTPTPTSSPLPSNCTQVANGIYIDNSGTSSCGYKFVQFEVNPSLSVNCNQILQYAQQYLGSKVTVTNQWVGTSCPCLGTSQCNKWIAQAACSNSNYSGCNVTLYCYTC